MCFLKTYTEKKVSIAIRHQTTITMNKKRLIKMLIIKKNIRYFDNNLVKFTK